MNDEVLRILRLVEEGKISSDKAKELIDLMNSSEEKLITKSYEEKFLRIKVLGGNGDKVNIQLPIKVIREVLKVSGKLPIKAEGMGEVDIEELMNTIVACLDNEVMGEIVNVEGANGDIVKIVIE